MVYGFDRADGFIDELLFSAGPHVEQHEPCTAFYQVATAVSLTGFNTLLMFGYPCYVR